MIYDLVDKVLGEKPSDTNSSSSSSNDNSNNNNSQERPYKHVGWECWVTELNGKIRKTM